MCDRVPFIQIWYNERYNTADIQAEVFICVLRTKISLTRFLCAKFICWITPRPHFGGCLLKFQSKKNDGAFVLHYRITPCSHLMTVVCHCFPENWCAFLSLFVPRFLLHEDESRGTAKTNFSIATVGLTKKRPTRKHRNSPPTLALNRATGFDFFWPQV